MRHTPELWLERLYARLPAFYRQQDLEIARLRSPGLDDGQAVERAPLRGLLRTLAGQVAAVRQDIDDLWDDFFLETCDDWVVPYLGALVGTTLLPNPVGQSNRQDVRNTLAWRRAKGTPAMLAGLARGITGWPADAVEGFRTLAWTQHTDHVRVDRPLTPSLRDPVALARLGTADDPFAHLPDLRPPGRPGTAGPGAAGGRHDLGTAVFFLRPLTTFPQRGVTPAAAAPGLPVPAGARAYTFDPLHEELPLFGKDGLPLESAAFAADPGTAFGPERDLVVRRAGVPLALAPAGTPSGTAADAPSGGASDGGPVEDFAFGAPGPSTRLHAGEGMRVLDPSVFRRPAEHFLVSALWFPDPVGPGPAAAPVRLGTIATSLLPDAAQAFRPDRPLGGAGRLVLRVETGRPDGLPGREALGTADAGRFPACEIAVRDDTPPRAARHDGIPATDGRFAGAVIAYLPEMFVWPGQPVDLLVTTDGSTYQVMPPDGRPPARGRLARASEGQAWPPAAAARPSTWPHLPDGGTHRVRGLLVTDRTRFAGRPGLVLEIHELAGVPRFAGALVTEDTPVSEAIRARLAVPPGQTVWPAFSYLPSRDAAADRIPVERTTLVALRVRALAAPGPGPEPAVSPPCEIVVTDRAGRALLAYLPEATLVADPGDELEGTPGAGPGALFTLGADGSTWTVPGGLQEIPAGTLPPGSALARFAQGQVLPLEGAVPLRRRRAVHGPARSGELGIDPERGRFCLAEDDPLTAVPPGDRDLTVDYTEAFPGPVGARAALTTSPAAGDDTDDAAPTRIVAATGDAAVRLPLHRVHRTLSDAVAASAARWTSVRAPLDEVIEIADSASYPERITLDFGPPGLPAAALRRHITIRAGGRTGPARPCLLAPDTSAAGTGPALVTVRGVTGTTPVEALSVDHVLHLSGLLIGGQVRVEDGFMRTLRIGACTLGPPSGAPAADADRVSVQWDATDPGHQSELLVASSVLAGVRAGPGVALVSADDSVLHRAGAGDRAGLAVGGPDEPGRTREQEAADPAGDRPARRVRLRRVTVLGRLRAGELEADESLLAALAVVDSRQNGCLRFSRTEPGSVLPRRYRCVPGDEDLGRGDSAHPSFGSLRPRSPLFAAIGEAASPLVRTASESGDQVGAFAGDHPGLRRANFEAKLTEFLPAGLRPVIVVEDRIPVGPRRTHF
ncbi:hypothetical protein ACFPM3_06555 [Streptomyces coeruleoprunus]|uniref:Uncharacterized protein n=1 Tax=Streptomyces coeruleoprunus TaxID=285563 RepID=A0ABV9XCX9_9ACTN